MDRDTLRRVLSLSSFSDNIRELFFKGLDHGLWTKDEIITLFNDAHLEAHMRVLKDLEEASVGIVEDK